MIFLVERGLGQLRTRPRRDPNVVRTTGRPHGSRDWYKLLDRGDKSVLSAAECAADMERRKAEREATQRYLEAHWRSVQLFERRCRPWEL